VSDHLHPGSRHAIPIRRPGFAFDASIPKHWLAGNPVATHVFNGLNLVFPDGERFFIQSVRDQLPKIEDPALRKQVKGFFGQEARHAHEHERYFEILETQGYEIRTFLRRFHRFIELTSRWFPAPLRLAVTAGAEHYTATFGAVALEDDFLDEAHPELRKLIVSAATEEVEHKAVAYDVLQATHPGYGLRILGFAVATLSLFFWAGYGTRMLVKQDGFDRATLRRELRKLQARNGGRNARAVARRVRDYFRRDFHPNQIDDLGLAHARLAELGLPAS